MPKNFKSGQIINWNSKDCLVYYINGEVTDLEDLSVEHDEDGEPVTFPVHTEALDAAVQSKAELRETLRAFLEDNKQQLAELTHWGTNAIRSEIFEIFHA